MTAEEHNEIITEFIKQLEFKTIKVMYIIPMLSIQVSPLKYQFMKFTKERNITLNYNKDLLPVLTRIGFEKARQENGLVYRIEKAMWEQYLKTSQ